ncbi:hypothetical protein FM106_26310 [Brachybacterium faecium]|nr:hypothetical protein FM106_26310 [Brachybacterium faecium]
MEGAVHEALTSLWRRGTPTWRPPTLRGRTGEKRMSNGD